MDEKNIATWTSASSGTVIYERKSERHNWTYAQSGGTTEQEIQRQLIQAERWAMRFLAQPGWGNYQYVVVKMDFPEGAIPYSLPRGHKFDNVLKEVKYGE